MPSKQIKFYDKNNERIKFVSTLTFFRSQRVIKKLPCDLQLVDFMQKSTFMIKTDFIFNFPRKKTLLCPVRCGQPNSVLTVFLSKQECIQHACIQHTCIQHTSVQHTCFRVVCLRLFARRSVFARRLAVRAGAAARAVASRVYRAS